MPRVAVQDSSRVSLRIRPEDKAVLVSSASYPHTDLMAFVLQNAVQVAKAVISEADHVALSERDSLRVLSALEDPPPANAKLLAAARALPILPHLHLAGGSAQAQV